MCQTDPRPYEPEDPEEPLSINCPLCHQLDPKKERIEDP
jgi:hypothetical protein